MSSLMRRHYSKVLAGEEGGLDTYSFQEFSGKDSGANKKNQRTIHMWIRRRLHPM